ncbi:hypothetical protein H072_3124 [Dactylellina haptotyla CBS 200.50]|uniref:Nephrocystin 3-like N-terminal domain-containing protein n=1 Tax=Dactylellina haptotyla (strain CBS 200.50) TaxID=1284197 RepID=S8AIN6_DACHA|nr:hypothetical protein H072_3124 [Dactylellina haptotyla CBS 200.50]
MAPDKAKTPFLACYTEARQQFRESTVESLKANSIQIKQLDIFLNPNDADGGEFDKLQDECKKLARDGEKNKLDGDKASSLLSNLERIKTLGDAVISMAPETVSIVWFGISSIITIATIGLEIRLMICGACTSITAMVQDCLRWEILSREVKSKDVEDASGPATKRPGLQTNIWESGVTGLLCNIFDFLWHAQPHRDPSRLKRLRSTIKEAFSKDLQQRVDTLTETYEKLVNLAQSQFKELVLENEKETRGKLLRIREDLKKSVGIASAMLESLQCDTLRAELNLQRAKVAESRAHQLYFEALNDRAKIILDQRKGHIADWLFGDPEYKEWSALKTETSSQNIKLLCLDSPRGHGKSTAMLCIKRRLQGTLLPDNKRPVVLFFFFKKGDQEVQNARTALQSILYQLLGREELRNNSTYLAKCIEILNPDFGTSEEEQKAGSSTTYAYAYDPTSIKSLCGIIRLIGELLPRVYLIVDALDECQDRQEKHLVPYLRSIVGSDQTNIRLILSFRNTINIDPELSLTLPIDPAKDTQNRDAEAANLEPWISHVHITAEKNSLDLRAYLTHDISRLLDRRINSKLYSDYYEQELNRLVDIMHKKANGDFALARLILANLKKPSKLSLDDKIKQLPAAIGEIYMSALESLKAEEQELVVTGLKWIVWGVSNFTVVELSDHYREVYRNDEDKSWNARPSQGSQLNIESTTESLIDRPQMSDEMDEPEIREIIHHLETIGQDFFRLEKHTGLVNVDISIREWIQDDSKTGSKSEARKTKGFDRYRNEMGATVFKFTLTPSFVQYGDTLSELFDEREAQMSISVEILRTLNNQAFQDRYMPWNPKWLQGIRVPIPNTRLRYEIAHWQDHLKILDKWWNEDCINDPWWSELLLQISIFVKRENWYRWALQPVEIQIRDPYHSPTVEPREMVITKLISDSPIHIASTFGLNIMLDYLLRQVSNEAPEFSKHGWRENLEFLETKVGGGKKLEEYRQRLQDMDYEPANRPNSWGLTPLVLAAPHPKTVEVLIKHGADANGSAYEWKIRGLYKYREKVALLWVLARSANKEQAKDLRSLLETAKILMKNGASLKVKDGDEITPLHYAALIQNLDFFKLICFSGDWNIQQADANGKTPLHFLFQQPPETKSKTQEVLEICHILVKMSERDGGAERLVNAQDINSRSPLVAAVDTLFLEGVEKLVELGVDVRDDDKLGNTCFHQLAMIGRSKRNSSEVAAIADILFDHGLDFKEPNQTQRAPFVLAWQAQNDIFLEWLLKKYASDSIEPGHEGEHPFLFISTPKGGNVFHFCCRSPVERGLFELIENHIPKEIILAGLREKNREGETPLICAARECPAAIEWLLKLAPELVNHRNNDGRTALDLYVETVSRNLPDNDEYGVRNWRIKISADTFPLLFRSTQPVERLTLFEDPFLTEKTRQEALRSLMNEDIVNFTREDITDEHGWSFLEIMTAWGFQPESLGNTERIARTSRILPPSKFSTTEVHKRVEILNDGLSLKSPSHKKRKAIFCSLNHPIPLNDNFYFECTFHLSDRFDEIYNPLRSDVYQTGLSIGPMGASGPERFWTVLSLHQMGVSSARSRDRYSLWRYTVGNPTPTTTEDEDELESGEIPEQKVPSVTFGLYTSMKRRHMVFTLNGHALPTSFVVPPERYYVQIVVESLYPDCSLNFGAEPFLFQPANEVGFLAREDYLYDEFHRRIHYATWPRPR